MRRWFFAAKYSSATQEASSSLSVLDVFSGSVIVGNALFDASSLLALVSTVTDLILLALVPFALLVTVLSPAS